MAQTKQVKAAAPLNNGLPGSFNSGGGVTLSSLRTQRRGTFSNTLSTADLNETSLEQAMIDIAAILMKNLKIAENEKDHPICSSFTEKIKELAQRVGTADNDINTLKTWGSV